MVAALIVGSLYSGFITAFLAIPVWRGSRTALARSRENWCMRTTVSGEDDQKLPVPLIRPDETECCEVWGSFFPVNTGVRQGCVLAPSLFNACMDWVLDKVVNQSDCGASVGNTKITDLVFADDAVIFAESLEVLGMALEALHEEAKPLGLEVSWLKTKVQVFGDLLDEAVQSVPVNSAEELAATNTVPVFRARTTMYNFIIAQNSGTLGQLKAKMKTVEANILNSWSFLSQVADGTYALLVIFAKSLEVLVIALETLHEEAKPLGLGLLA
ncbi:Retrovirus-related Pol polyprotein from type-1 retrotransposable element R2 [Chionoecetes opilio]|uniref:Retrovirus-related Pol polyprotein from type-1 retrotransposable element R2 n=1 Tax=Chionoecetes opilio TaxID=41210 RepID=A0A8J4Y0Z8_CHIOP|nr:Retrovirus-related Pol polyprotein from type-1 retrotransposable element R2 [Chionoecetes opilio]